MSPCVRWASRMRFRLEISGWCALPAPRAQSNWNSALKAGDPGARMQRCTYGRRMRKMEQIVMESPVGRLLLEGDEDGLRRIDFDGQGNGGRRSGSGPLRE